MSSSTFKGKYKECNTCTHQIKRDGKFNCNLSYSKVRNNANGVGIKHERYKVSCGMYDKISNKQSSCEKESLQLK